MLSNEGAYCYYYHFYYYFSNVSRPYLQSHPCLRPVLRQVSAPLCSHKEIHSYQRWSFLEMLSGSQRRSFTLHIPEQVFGILFWRLSSPESSFCTAPQLAQLFTKWSSISHFQIFPWASVSHPFSILDQILHLNLHILLHKPKGLTLSLWSSLEGSLIR